MKQKEYSRFEEQQLAALRKIGLELEALTNTSERMVQALQRIADRAEGIKL